MKMRCDRCKTLCRDIELHLRPGPRLICDRCVDEIEPISIEDRIHLDITGHLPEDF